jgi:hypothetical protein
MRGGRSFLVLLAVAIGLGAYVYFVESKRPAGDEASKKQKVFNVESDKIDQVTIKSASGDTTTLKKSGTSWQITQPAAGQADQAEASGVASNLASAEIQRVIDENPSDLKEFGLAAPRIDVAFKSGNQDHRLLIGDKTPTGSDLYARADDQKKVFLIPSYLESTFNKGTFDLRDKTVLKVDAQAVDGLEITTATRTAKFEKKNGEWQITQPFNERGDYGTVDALASKVASAQMKALTAPEATDLKQYGLDKPVATVRLNSGSSQASLAIGAAAADGTVYAKDLSRPAVFTIESTILDDVKKDPVEYRQKDLFDARTFNATRVEVTRNGQTVAFEKTKVKDKDGKEEEKWRQVAPSARDVDSAKVESLITAATGARAMGFVTTTEKTGLEKPEVTIAIKYDEGKKEDRVAFARSGSNGYASRAGSQGAATVETSTIDGIIKALENLK